jgi:hypothetical protein
MLKFTLFSYITGERTLLIEEAHREENSYISYGLFKIIMKGMRLSHKQ